MFPVTYAFLKDVKHLPSLAKVQDFLKLITKQSHNLINLGIVFLTIAACKMRHPVYCHEVKYCFGMLIAYSLCYFSQRILELITYLMRDHQSGLLHQVRNINSNLSSIEIP